MKTRMLVMGSLSALVLGGTMVGCTAGGSHGIASASDRDPAANGKAARDNAGRATRALARRDGDGAIGFAEAAVALSPREAEYRMLLGQSYLQGGRFASAKTAFGDALALTPANGKAALNLALAQVATGDFVSARETLAGHAESVPAADLGLALALAGDPASAVQLLTQLVRSPQATVKARQNLALALALGGDWNAARLIASADLSPADVDKRIEQWAMFAQPHAASDQVASLLGVKAGTDNGQPVALALNAAVPTTPAMPEVQTAAIAPEPAPPTPQPAAVAVASAPDRLVIDVPEPAPRQVTASAPVPTLRPTGPIKVALGAPRGWSPAKGSWFVQLGAFGSPGVARDAWGRATRRMPALAVQGPNGMTFATRTRSFYRLSVGGFARGDADTMCRHYRATGGVCFVRTGAGDQTAHWARKAGTQLASR